MLSRHPGKCRWPHGHSRTVELVLEAQELDANGMVTDFATLKHAVKDIVEAYDHALCVNTADPDYALLAERFEPAIVAFEDQEPTTEALARRIFDDVARRLAEGDGPPSTTRLVRVRISETSSTWAEYEA